MNAPQLAHCGGRLSPARVPTTTTTTGAAAAAIARPTPRMRLSRWAKRTNPGKAIKTARKGKVQRAQRPQA